MSAGLFGFGGQKRRERIRAEAQRRRGVSLPGCDRTNHAPRGRSRPLCASAPLREPVSCFLPCAASLSNALPHAEEREAQLRFNQARNRCSVQTGRGATTLAALSQDGRNLRVSSVPVFPKAALFRESPRPVPGEFHPVNQEQGECWITG